MEEAKGINFNQIDWMRREGEFRKKRIEDVEKLQPDAIAAELYSAFGTRILNLNKIYEEKEFWRHKANMFIDFCKDNGLSSDNVKDLLILIGKLTSP